MSDYLVAGSRVTISTTIVERTGPATTATTDLSAGGITGVDILTKVDNNNVVIQSCTISDGPGGVVVVTLPSATVQNGRRMKLQWRVNSGLDPLITKPLFLDVL